MFVAMSCIHTTEAIPTALKSECASLLDLILVVDGSDSILEVDYKKQRLALASLMRELHLGPKESRVGVVVYSTTIAQVIPLTYDVDRLVNETSTLVHPRDGTNTALGISKMIEMFKSDGRQNVPWVSIVITDGISKDPALTAQEAALARDMKVNMFAVGISHLIYQAELEAIASSPQQVLMLQTFDQLKMTLSSLMKVVCPCSPPPTVLFATIDDGSRVIGTVRTYTCDAGYQPLGDSTIVCLNDTNWSPVKFTCAACPPPPLEHGNAVVLEGPHVIGAIREYVCKKGFSSPQPFTITCIKGPNGPGWTTPTAVCTACEEPPNVPHAVLTMPGDTLVGTVRTYMCMMGFQPTGPIEVVCKASNGNIFWEGLGHVCVACTAPPVLPNAAVDSTGETLIGSIRTYSCMKGFVATGPIYVSCVSGPGSPVWTPAEFQCIACGAPPILPHAVLDPKGDSFVGDQRLYQCTDGYVPNKSGPIMIECMGEYVENRGRAYWSNPSHECITCATPPLIENADVDPGTNLVGQSRRYQCKNGFVTTGPIIVTCLSTANWSLAEHSCMACGPTPTVPNADVIPGPYLVGTVRKYKCNDGYVSNNSPEITCLKEAQWSPVEFTCMECNNPYPVGNAVLEPGSNLVGSIRRYTCLPGYLETGPITSTCAVPPNVFVPDWSTPVHLCKDCGNPYVVEHATAVPGPKMIGAVQRYVCESGYVPSGPQISHCMQNAAWSPPDFQCITCSDPPVLSFANVDKVGTNLVGSVRAYTCVNGFVATGPIETMCTAAPVNDTNGPTFPNWRNTSSNYCKDCGVPPNMTNAYANIGPSEIGSTRKYTCNAGYEMSGNGMIECMATGFWSHPSFSCNVKTTTTTVAPKPLKQNPSVCDGCRMLNGVGYMKHPSDCTQFVQCFFSAKGGIEAVYMPCPFGQYWDQSVLTCRPAAEVECLTEKCMDPRLISYKHVDSTKCCAYWQCNKGKSVAKCCGEGFRYEAYKGCVPDPFCTAECPWEDMFPSCDKRPVLDKTKFEQHIGNGYWVKMPCAPGTAFNIIDCQCTVHTGVTPSYVCRPELYLNFDNDAITDLSGNNLYIVNEGVKAFNGSAYFDGSSRLLINRFSNTAFHGYLVIKFRYKEHLQGPKANSLQALVTNGDCGDDPSIIIAKMPGYVLCGAKTNQPKSFALPVVEKEWKEVIYIHDEQKLEGKVCGASYNKWSLGPIEATHCGIQFGYGTKLANFLGLLDDISVYQCLPPDDVLSVYGGRQFPPNAPITMVVH